MTCNWRGTGTSMMFTSNIRAQLTPGYKLPKLTGDQIVTLEDNFKQNRNPNDFEISLMSAESGILEYNVKLNVGFDASVEYRTCLLPRHLSSFVRRIEAYTGQSRELEFIILLWYQHRLAVWRQRQGLPANFGYVHD